MYRHIRALILVGSLIAASHAEAAIVINEVAWMGTDIEGGSNCEWIELFNPDASAVNVSGWTIEIANAGGSTPKVLTVSELDGFATVIEPSGFYLLARNTGVCLENSPGAQAQWSGSFGTGISNTGSKLTLRDSAGITMDMVDAESGWIDSGVGGYNASGKEKLTPQRSGTTWVTAKPTPLAVNATQSETTDAGTGSSPTKVSTTKKASLPQVYVEAGSDRIVSVGAHVDYGALVYTEQGRVVSTAKVHWSFGDGSSARSQGAYHKFHHPGEYLVRVIGESGWKSAEDSFVVTADIPDIRISHVSEEGVTLENYDSRILDLSNWKLSVDDSWFKIPRGTSLLPGRSVIFPQEVTLLPVSENAKLLFPDDKNQSAYEPATSTDPGEY